MRRGPLPGGGPPAALTRLPVVGRLFAALREASDVDESPFALAALERHKREGMELAFRARLFAMAVIAIVVPILNPAWDALWYEFLVLCFVLIGYAQRRVAEVGQSGREVGLIVADVALMIVVIVLPNPLASEAWPLAMQYRGGGFIYLFILLAFATLAYSWRTVWGFGVLVTIIWMSTYGAVAWLAPGDPALTTAAEAAFGGRGDLAAWLDPNRFLGFIRVQEVIAFLIVAATLATTVRRFSRLMIGHAALERERANLARYFSPNVVEQLSHSDEPLKEVRTQDVAVLFVDIVGFTSFAAERSSAEVIATLRDFHARMEREVFAHDGTLDKYLGDGLMATFGTPFAGPHDATNALTCARAMMRAVDAWNAERAAAGAPPVRASFGLHFGPAVLGDIGATRLEFAVIGDTVNVASRVEALSRTLDASLVATTALKDQVERESADCGALIAGMEVARDQAIRGLDASIDVWTLRE